ncbi:DNA/RNA helicase domain-containing protein [Bacillus wiedmannii]|uniref:DNA/RNA helicase domain-containing protein n=1 Tax=Bacillus wiedmannii TaxID=1890302 RepID=UPI000A883B55|nr:DNA/RNA helicase domain-containing protein [Bacillus wiedmannii]
MVQSLLNISTVTYNLVEKNKTDFQSPIARDEKIDKKPLVYILKKGKTLYIGKTVDVYSRFVSHLSNKDFIEVLLILSPKFNDSSIKHIETLLIDYLLAEGKYKLTNDITGQNIYEYDGIEQTLDLFPEIWSSLIDKRIATENLKDIENKFIFKYSPFKALSIEQRKVCNKVIDKLLVNNNSRQVISGEPGTGKSVVLSTILHQLVHDKEIDREHIALIIPQTHLLKSYKLLIRKVGLQGVQVFTPAKFINSNKSYRYVFVDESHRLKQYFGKQAGLLKHIKTADGWANELDMISNISHHLVLIYDKYQSIRPADIDEEIFNKAFTKYKKYNLRNQFRLKSGKEYLTWLRKYLQITEGEVVYDAGILKGYDFQVVDSISELYEKISNLNDENNLSRVVSGYSWEWKTKSRKGSEVYDIIDGEKGYRWNSKIEDWINTENSSKEIGCIHTIQGADLNYVGVIIGKELTYNPSTQKIEVIRENYFDRNGSTIISEDKDNQELLSYVKRIYYVLLSRGIDGCYIYVENPELKKYLKQIAERSR